MLPRGMSTLIYYACNSITRVCARLVQVVLHIQGMAAATGPAESDMYIVDMIWLHPQVHIRLSVAPVPLQLLQSPNQLINMRSLVRR